MTILLISLALIAAADRPMTVAERSIVERIERQVTMPRGASSLQAYDRYYARENREDGIEKVLAVFVRNGRPGQHWVDQRELPLVLDGGCTVVSLAFDMASGRVEYVECNGEA